MDVVSLWEKVGKFYWIGLGITILLTLAGLFGGLQTVLFTTIFPGVTFGLAFLGLGYANGYMLAALITSTSHWEDNLLICVYMAVVSFLTSVAGAIALEIFSAVVVFVPGTLFALLIGFTLIFAYIALVVHKAEN